MSGELLGVLAFNWEQFDRAHAELNMFGLVSDREVLNSRGSSQVCLAHGASFTHAVLNEVTCRGKQISAKRRL